MSLQVAVELKGALEAYRAAVSGATRSDDVDDYKRIISITEKLIDDVEKDDREAVKLSAFAFSRSVSDSFAEQPLEYRKLSNIIAKLKA